MHFGFKNIAVILLNPRRRRLLYLLLVIIIILFIRYRFPNSQLVLGDIYHQIYPNLSINCHSHHGPSLSDISNHQPAKGRSIFFHETSCDSFINGKVIITARQACAVESAASMNPSREVYLLYASPGVIRNDGTESDRFLKALASYPNIKILHVDVGNYLQGTPVEHLWKQRILSRSWYAQSHISDVLRYVTLWKYGGIYLDLDVIVVKNLEDLAPNHAGAESPKSVASGVLGFTHDGSGHKFVDMCLEDLRHTFSWWDWGHNGPGTITRLLRKLCDAKTATEMLTRDCGDMVVYPQQAFYAVPWWNWTIFFDENFSEYVETLSKNSYVIHVWNKFSRQIKVQLDSKVSYLKYARKFCPKIVQQCDKYF